MTTDYNRLRTEFLNTQVITRNSGKRLGVVRELLVDIDRREVVALGLRDNRLSLSGIPKYMYLSSIIQTGDVILVEDEDVLVDVEIEAYSQLINCEVITETGQPLGRVRDFTFNLDDGKVSSLILASLGLAQIPDRIISTYELPIEEIISSGPNRLIVFEGAEDRLVQLTVGILENIGIGKPPWEREEETYYPPTARPENQLGTGTPIRTPLEARESVAERWDEDEWEEPGTIVPSRQPVKAEPVRYEEYEYAQEEDNWGKEVSEPPRYKAQPLYEPSPREKEYEYEDVQNDVWDDDIGSEPYNPPPVNFKEKQKAPEYYEEEA